MTAIVGILCKEGVVIGSDSSTTFVAGQNPTIEQPSKKINIIDNRYIIAGTGSVGLGQRFIYEVKNFMDSSTHRKQEPVEICRQISQNSIKNFISTQAPMGGYGALFAFGANGNKFNLCEFEIKNMQPELKNDKLWYVSMGSGQNITDPFLGFIRKLFWHQGMPSLSEGIFATIWTLQHACELNPGGIKEPIDVAILENKDGNIAAKLLIPEELVEHTNYIKELEKHIMLFPSKKETDSEIEDIPTLENNIE